MGKTIELMNYNLVNGTDNKKSYLAEIILEVYKTALQNETYQRMIPVFDANMPSDKCFNNPSRYQDLSYVINFHKTIKKTVENEFVEEKEEVRGRQM